jgi:exodeoxyribonuclease V alpha subunit
LRAAADGTVTVSGAHGQRALPADYTRDHLELGYATTVYGVHGETTTHAQLAVGEHTTAASAYVGMTRGRDSNVAHLVADSLDEARDQWAVVFARDRADLGPTHAAELARHEAARYARLRPLDDVLSELHAAWTAEADFAQRLPDVEQRHHQLADIVALTHQRDATVPALRQAHEVARAAAQHASAEAGRLEELVSTRAADLAATLQHQWDQQRDAARHAAQTVRSGPGRLGHRRTAVRHATEQLANWSATWQPYLPTMPTRAEDIAAFARWFDDAPQIHWLFDSYARSVAETAVPDYGSRCAAAEAAVRARDETMREYRDADSYYRDGLAHHGNTAHIDDPAAAFADTERLFIASKNRLGQAQARVNALIGEPALRAQPAERITLERDRWRADRDQRSREYARSTQLEADAAPQHHQHEPSRSDRPSYAQPDHSPSISR